MRPSQLFKVVWILPTLKSEPLLSWEETINCDIFAKFCADKMLRISCNLDHGYNIALILLPKEIPYILPVKADSALVQ